MYRRNFVADTPSPRPSPRGRGSWSPGWGESPGGRELVAEPGAGIFNDFQGEFLLVDGVGFVAGAEIEDLALADFPEAGGAEMLALVPAFFEDDGVGLGDVEGLVVHFGLGDVEGFGDAAGDDVAAGDDADVGGFAVGAKSREDTEGES